MSRRDGPPPVAEKLLRRTIPTGLRGHSILGDLQEEYRLVMGRRGTGLADIWYWFNAILLSVQYSLPTDGGRHRRSHAVARRATNRANTMESLLHDVRFSARNLFKRPGFTIVVMATFAVGIGGTVAMFSAINAVFLRPLPYQDPDQLVFGTRRSSQGAGGFVSGQDYLDYREQSDAFQSLATIRGFELSATVTGDGAAERVSEQMASTELFATLRVAPALGRDFVKAEEKADADRVVMLSYGFWQRRFGGEGDVIGRTLGVDGQPHIVVGVMPSEFDFPKGTEIWRPMREDTPWASSRGPQNWFVVGRLKEDATIVQAQEQVDVIGARLEEEYPATNTDRRLHLTSFHERLVSRARPMFLVFTGAVGLVLLIACANVAGLLLARGVTRSSELAVRSALGASRGRLLRQLLTESVLLATSGGALGLMLTFWLLRVVKQFAPPDVPGIRELGVDGTALVIALGLSVVTGLLVGLLPALKSASSDVSQNLSPGRGASERSSATGLRGALVVGQVTLSLVLLIGAGLLMRSFLQLQSVDPGFDADRLLTAEVALPRDGYPSSQELTQFYRTIVSDLNARPGVMAAGAISRLPIASGGGDYPVYPEENPPADPSERSSAIARSITPGYFDAMRVPLLSGRAVDANDTGDAPPVVVVDEALVRRYYPDQNPLGKNLVLGFREPRSVQIVGVVGEVLASSLNDVPYPTMYFSVEQWQQRTMTLAVRTTAQPTTFTNTLRAAVRDLDPNVPVAKVASMRSVISDSVSQPRTTTLFLGGFATVALLLAALGLYGVLAYFVNQRTREIGIRIALGAAHGKVLGLVLRRGLLLVGVGVALGIGGAVATTRFLQSLLFEVGTTDLLTFAGVSLLLTLVAVAACAIPAWRATRVDLLTALRVE
jgi:putative ABC transport system permease protein